MFRRPIFFQLLQRLREKRNFLQILTGPRQVGKTTLVRQIEKELGPKCLYVSADESQLKDPAWIETHWQRGRRLAREHSEAVLIIDEVQKIQNWSETIKSLWDRDTAEQAPLKVVLLGSSPFFMRKGKSESLAGRFEVIHATHWPYSEMKECFQLSLDDYAYWGGYPGGITLKQDADRWKQFIREALIEVTVSQDLLSTVRIDKPILLKRLFYLSCEYSGQILSYNKMIGQLQDAGNTTTLAHYLDLLTYGGLATGLEKWSSKTLQTRSSSPKLITLNPALFSAVEPRQKEELLSDPETRGRIFENLVGGHLWNSILGTSIQLYYWNEGQKVVDYVLSLGEKLLAIEVKSGRRQTRVPGLTEFCKKHPHAKPLLIGTDGIPFEEFLLSHPRDWF